MYVGLQFFQLLICAIVRWRWKEPFTGRSFGKISLAIFNSSCSASCRYFAWVLWCRFIYSCGSCYSCADRFLVRLSVLWLAHLSVLWLVPLVSHLIFRCPVLWCLRDVFFLVFSLIILFPVRWWFCVFFGRPSADKRCCIHPDGGHPAMVPSGAPPLRFHILPWKN